MTAVKWDVKLLHYVSTPCNIHIPTVFLWHTHTHKCITHAHRDIYTEGMCIIETVKRQSISFQMTVFIIRFPSPHHLCLHHLAPIPGLHIRICEIHTHTHISWVCIKMHICIWTLKKSTYSRCRQMHRQKPQTYTCTPRPPSCHRAKPPACLTLPLRMFWTFCCYVVFPVMWVCVSLCLIYSLVSWRDRSWRRPSDWTVTNPLTTRLAIIGYDHTEGNWVSRWQEVEEDWMVGEMQQWAGGTWEMKVKSVWFKSFKRIIFSDHSCVVIERKLY